jgi:hypothetical protein
MARAKCAPVSANVFTKAVNDCIVLSAKCAKRAHTLYLCGSVLYSGERAACVNATAT